MWHYSFIGLICYALYLNFHTAEKINKNENDDRVNVIVSVFFTYYVSTLVEPYFKSYMICYLKHIGYFHRSEKEVQ